MRACYWSLENSVGKRHPVLILVMWILLALLPGGAMAEIVTNLHSATVPVAGQGDKALASAARRALSEVLVKVSGSSQLLGNPQIKEALSQSRSQVQQFSYVRGRPPANELQVNMEFDAAYVTDLVRRAGAPLWTANRPLVLAWVVVDGVVDGEEGRQFINWDATPVEAQMLVDEFSRRGVPVQIPVFDLVDVSALGVDDAWRLNGSAIRSASARYDVQHILAGRLATLSGGQATGDWRYFYQDEHSNRSVTVPDLESFLRGGVNLVADQMAGRYALLPTTGGGDMRMVVLGVIGYADYAAIVHFLENLELVESVDIQRVQGERLELRLQTAVDAAQLATLIELNNRLSPLPVVGTEAQLNYQWQQ